MVQTVLQLAHRQGVTDTQWVLRDTQVPQVLHTLRRTDVEELRYYNGIG